MDQRQGIDVRAIIRTNLQSLRYSVMEAIGMVVFAHPDGVLTPPNYKILTLEKVDGSKERVLAWDLGADGWVYFSYEAETFKPSDNYQPAALADYAEIADAIVNYGWLEGMTAGTGDEHQSKH